MSEMELASLADIPVGHLAPLFREEASHWNKQLFWDYTPTLQLVRKMVASRGLPGFVLRHQGTTVGYSYFVLDQLVGFIGGLYVLDSFAEEPNYRRLIDKLVTTMRGLKSLERIESQVIPFNIEFAPSFLEQGFRVLPRYFLSAGVGSKDVSKRLAGLERVDGINIERWRPELVASAANVIYDSYIESPDMVLCRDYQSRKGCMRFLRNLIESPACGRFSHKDTRIALDLNGRLCGVLLATKISDSTGMVPQLSVRRDCQGRGIGSWLLAEYMKAAEDAGLERVSLSVSQANRRAFELYVRLGFKTTKRFDALIWDRVPGSVETSTPDPTG